VLLAAGGIAAAGAMLGASVTVAYGLATGFDRTAARAQLPDVLATFQPEPRRNVERVVSSLANVRAASYRIQAAHVFLAGGRRRYEDDATVVGVPPGAPAATRSSAGATDAPRGKWSSSRASPGSGTCDPGRG
jgi:hypothetical protein